MTDIAHCSRCGHLPKACALDDEEPIYYYECLGCGKSSSGDADSTEALRSWTRAVLSDLAAQERELWLAWETLPDVEVQWGNVRNVVRSRYIWLGQNPLSLPT